MQHNLFHGSRLFLFYYFDPPLAHKKRRLKKFYIALLQFKVNRLKAYSSARA